MKLTTSELVYINEAAKALKQKDFILIDNAIIGLNNIDNMIIYTLLDTNFIKNYCDGIIINQRSLSAFVKTLTIESDFEFDSIDNTIRTIAGGELVLAHDLFTTELACSKFKYAISLHNNIQTMINEEEIPDIADKIYIMNATSGAIGINYKGYYMTLFPAFLPINKGDKMYVSILQDNMESHTFVARFCIKKKKFDVVSYLNYLKI